MNRNAPASSAVRIGVASLAALTSLEACSMTVAGGDASRVDGSAPACPDGSTDASRADRTSDPDASRDATDLDEAPPYLDAASDGGTSTDGSQADDAGVWSELSDVPMLERSFRSCALHDTRTHCATALVHGGTCVLQARPPPARPDRLTVSTFGLNLLEVSVGRFQRFFLAGMPSLAQTVPYRGGPWRPHVFMPHVEPQRPPDGGIPADMSLPWRYSWPTRWDSNPLPIIRVNQTVAQAFCVWDGGRLPTVAEMFYLLHCWPSGGREVTARLYPLGDAHPRCDDGNWGGGDGTAESPCALRLRTIIGFGRFRRFGPFADLIGNAEEWRADRCNPLGRTATDPLCLSASEETAPGETEPSWFFYDGGSIDTERFAPVAPGALPLAAVEMPRRRAEWEPTNHRNPANEAILGVRCAYDVP